MSFLYWLLCLIIGFIPAFFIYRKDKKRKIPLKWLPSFLRFLLFFLSAALLLAPAFPAKKTIEEKPIILWLQDASASMKQAVNKDSTVFKSKIKSIWNENKDQYKVIPLAFGASLKNKPTFRFPFDRTDITAAVQEAEQQYQSQNVAAVVLVSDGNYNVGNNPVFGLQGSNLPVYTVGIGDSARPKDLSVSFARANKTAILGNKFELFINVQATKLNGQTSEIKIFHDGKIVAQQQFAINSSYFNKSFRFYLNADKKGLQRYTIMAAPLSGENNTKNNKKNIFVNVLDKKINILIAASAPHPDIAAIKEALKNNPEYKIKIKYGKQIPNTVSGVDLLITHDLPDDKGIEIPKHGAIPVWNILGGSTDLAAFSKEQSFLAVLPKGNVENTLPTLNASFGLFALPKDIRKVLPQMPPLKVPVADYQLSGGQILLYQNNSKLPLWAIQAGQTPHAVLVGNGLWRWRLYAFKNFQDAASVDELIRQTISLLTFQSNPSPFKVNLDKYQFQDRGPVLFNATLQDATGELVNTPEAQLVLTDSVGKKTNFTFNKSGNSYQLSVGNLLAGNYSYEGKINFNGKEFTDKGEFTVASIPLEQLKNYSDFGLLYKLAVNTGGKFYTLNTINKLPEDLAKNPNLKPILRETTTIYNWIDLKWLFAVIILTATAEWLLRKYWGL